MDQFGYLSVLLSIIVGFSITQILFGFRGVVLSRDATVSADDIILAGSVTHAGLLDPNQAYTGRATVTLSRDLTGDYYVLVPIKAKLY